MKSKGSLGVQEGVIRCVGPSGLRSTACIAFRGSTGDRQSHVHPAPVLKLFEIETVLICDAHLLVVVIVRRGCTKFRLYIGTMTVESKTRLPSVVAWAARRLTYSF